VLMKRQIAGSNSNNNDSPTTETVPQRSTGLGIYLGEFFTHSSGSQTSRHDYKLYVKISESNLQKYFCKRNGHSSMIYRRCQEARPNQARVVRLPPLASRPAVRSVVSVSTDVQGAAWTATVVYRRPLLTSHNRRS